MLTPTSGRARCVLTVLASVLVFGGLGMAPAQADPCDTSVANCRDIVVPLQARVLATIVPVRRTARALRLYRALIPAPYSMPAHPAVGVYLEKLDAPHQVPGNPETNYTNWMEGGLDIRVSHHGEQGWFRLSVPVNSEYEFQSGRAAGFPKEHAAMTEAQLAGGRWHMDAAGRGRRAYDLTWTPTGGSVTPLLRNYVLSKEAIFLLNAPLKGPEAIRYRFILKPPTPAGDIAAPGSAQLAPVTALPEPLPGFLHVRMDADIDRLADQGLPHVFAAHGGDLGDLINLDQIRPGTMFDSQQELVVLQSQAIGQGGYAPVTHPTSPRRSAPRRSRRGARRRAGRHAARRRRGHRARRRQRSTLQANVTE